MSGLWKIRMFFFWKWSRYVATTWSWSHFEACAGIKLVILLPQCPRRIVILLCQFLSWSRSIPRTCLFCSLDSRLLLPLAPTYICFCDTRSHFCQKLALPSNPWASPGEKTTEGLLAHLNYTQKKFCVSTKETLTYRPCTSNTKLTT